MGYLYNSFCYSNFESFRLALYSSSHSLPSGSSVTNIRNLAIIDPSKLTITFESDYSYTLYVEVANTQYDLNNIATATHNGINYLSPAILSQSRYSFPLYIAKCSNPGHSIEDMNITLQNPPDNFNPSNLNPADVFNSIGSGFLLVAVPLAVVWAGRHFLRPLFFK